MILAQAVLQIFCWQGSIGLQCMSKKGHNFCQILQKVNLQKVNQVICIMYANSIPDIMILAQAVIQMIALLYKMPKSETGDNSAKYLQNFAKS